MPLQNARAELLRMQQKQGRSEAQLVLFDALGERGQALCDEKLGKHVQCVVASHKDPLGINLKNLIHVEDARRYPCAPSTSSQIWF